MAAGRLRRLFDFVIPGGEAVVSTSTAYSGISSASGFVLHLPDSAAEYRVRRRMRVQSLEPARATIVPHEVAHLALASIIRRTNKDSIPDEPSRRIPEWFGEAVAVYAEPLEARLQRVGSLRKSPDRLALRRNVLREHPVRLQVNYRRREIQTDPPCPRCGWSRWRKVVVAELPDGSIATDTSYYATRDMLLASDIQLQAPDYYSSSLVLLALIHHETGARGVRSLLERCLDESRRGKSVTSSDCGIPWPPDVLQEKWTAWLARSASDDTLLAGGPDPSLTPPRRAPAPPRR